MALQSNEYNLRPLEVRDFHKGYFELLEQLTVVGDVSETQFVGRLEQLQKRGELHHVLVVEDVPRSKVVATGSLMIEEKFIRNCGKVGHIEDVVVDKGARGLHLGQRVVEALTTRAKEAGCYKVILDCTAENASFYEKCGFFRKDVQMAHYF